MYNPVIKRSVSLALAERREHMSSAISTLLYPANIVGLLGSIFTLFCLIALPPYWNLFLPLYCIMIVWTIIRPRTALYLLPIAVPWGSLHTLDLGGIHLNSADILVAGLAASWLMSFALLRAGIGATATKGPLDRDRATLQAPRYLVLAMSVLLFTMLLSMTVTFSLSSSLKELSKWLEAIVIILLGAQYVQTRRHIWILVVIICLAGISQAIFGYIQAFLNLGPTSFINDAGLRVYGTFDQPNPYAGYINLILSITLALTLLSQTWKVRILAGGTTLLLALATYLSQSRGGTIAIATALLFIVILGMPLVRKLAKFGTIGVLGILAAYLAGLLPERIITPIVKKLGLVDISLTAPSITDFSTAERLAHWIAGIRMFLEHPFLGVGIGSYPDAYPKYFITIFANPLGHAHNYYINMAAEAGVFGLIALLLFLLSVFVAGGDTFHAINTRYVQMKAQRAQPRSTMTTGRARAMLQHMQIIGNDRALAVGLLAALLSVCVHNFVDNLFVHSMTNLFALLLIMLIRLKGVTSNMTSYGGGRFDNR